MTPVRSATRHTSIRYGLGLAAVLLLAALLRVWGIGWGLPTAAHYFSYHPDETVVLSAALGFSMLQGTWLPHFYNYGSLQLYLVNLVITLRFLLGGPSPVVQDFAQHIPQWSALYLTGRCVTAVMGVGTVALTAWLGTRLWGRRAGLLAAAVLAVMPLHAQQSHWLTVDVPATFWGVACLCMAARCLDKPSLRTVCVAGLLAGFAAATKYNLALLCVPLVWACSVGSAELRVRLLRIAACVAAMALGFLVACPGSVLEWAQFHHDVAYEAHHMRDLPGLEFAGTGNGLVYLAAHTLPAALSWAGLVLAVCGMVRAVQRRESGDILLALLFVPYCLVLSLVSVRYARYAMPLLPILAVWIGRWVAEWTRRRNIGARVLQVAACALGACMVMSTLQLLVHMAVPDTRDTALASLEQGGAHTVAFPKMPWFQTVPITPWTTLPHPGEWVHHPRGPFAVAYGPGDWNLAAAVQADAVVVSSLDTRDDVRLHSGAERQYVADLQRRSVRTQHLVTSVWGMPDPPSDMLYPGPSIDVYWLRH